MFGDGWMPADMWEDEAYPSDMDSNLSLDDIDTFSEDDPEAAADPKAEDDPEAEEDANVENDADGDEQALEEESNSGEESGPEYQPSEY